MKSHFLLRWEGTERRIPLPIASNSPLNAITLSTQPNSGSLNAPHTVHEVNITKTCHYIIYLNNAQRCKIFFRSE